MYHLNRIDLTFLHTHKNYPNNEKQAIEWNESKKKIIYLKKKRKEGAVFASMRQNGSGCGGEGEIGADVCGFGSILFFSCVERLSSQYVVP